jgi:hypothetical protein
LPLAFPSLTHGTVAFGFFNIDVDMLLLDRLFFFAHEFCSAVAQTGEDGASSIPGWRIDDPLDIGNLHGAIAGQDHTGFIGATYARWPFPQAPEDFKQDPGGHVNRDAAREMIAGFGVEEPIALERDAGRVAIGEYAFDRTGFAALVRYVDRGGYPRWRDERRPGYVLDMMESDAVRALLGCAMRGG